MIPLLRRWHVLQMNAEAPHILHLTRGGAIITHILGETARKRQEGEGERRQQPAKENLYEAAAWRRRTKTEQEKKGEEGKEGGRDQRTAAPELR